MVIKEKRTLINSIIKSAAILLVDAALITVAVILKDGFFILLSSILTGCIIIAAILLLIAPAILKLGAVDGECIVPRGNKAKISFCINQRLRFLYGKIVVLCNISNENGQERAFISLPYDSAIKFLCKYVGSWQMKVDSFYLWDPFGIFVRKIKIKNQNTHKHICVLPLERKSLKRVCQNDQRFESLLRQNFNNLELDGVRLYNAGDPIAQIAWKMVARTQKLYVKNMIGVNNAAISITYVYNNDPYYTTVATELIFNLCRFAFANGNDTVNINSGNISQIFNKNELSSLAIFLACAQSETDVTLFDDNCILVVPSGCNANMLAKFDAERIIFIGDDLANSKSMVIDGIEEWVNNYG